MALRFKGFKGALGGLGLYDIRVLSFRGLGL